MNLGGKLDVNLGGKTRNLVTLRLSLRRQLKWTLRPEFRQNRPKFAHRREEE